MIVAAKSAEAVWKRYTSAHAQASAQATKAGTCKTYHVTPYVWEPRHPHIL